MAGIQLLDIELDFNDQTGTTYTLLASDNGKYVTFNNAAAITVTLPNNLPKGWYCMWDQVGAGQITFTPASGASKPHRLNHTKSAGQNADGMLMVRSNTTGTAAVYKLSGDTST